MVELRRRCDSKLETKWLDMIERFVLRPPSDAQFLVESCSTRPDFFYREFNAAIYVDGPVHDEPDQIRGDEEITQRLMEMGYVVVRFHHKADWLEVFKQHPDIFGVPQV
jgi:very-short-patch-repair endonuclease